MRARWCIAAVVGLLTGAMFARADIPQKDKRSGSEFMSAENRAVQADDTSNPGMLWTIDGERLWLKPEGAKGASCASCHQKAAESMRGVAARYPAWNADANRPVDLAGRINLCRRTKQSAEPFAYESDALLALTAYVAHQSRGMPITPSNDARLAPFREAGKRFFEQRMGQFDLACANCHDDNWRGRLGGSPITQAHPTAYPIYRLEWQTLGSLQRRLRGCMVGVRAEPYDFGAPEFINLELFLMSRAAGLPIETPGVRP